ncbi:hypothetical protein JB92DRAFT_3104904 [Gautieria morchelliformis]|nr:hypothetical protein JB92DRAFT_3104904 [Gautieria morchelliformis]
MKEIKEVKVWLESSAFTLHLVFVEADTSSALCPVLLRHPWKEPEVKQRTGKDPEGMLPALLYTLAVPRESPEPQCIERPVWTKQPMFLSSDEDGDNAPTLKKAQTGNPPQRTLEPAWSPSIEVIPDDQPPPPHRKGRVNAQVTEADKVPQSVMKQGYPEHVFLLGWKIVKIGF